MTNIPVSSRGNFQQFITRCICCNSDVSKSQRHQYRGAESLTTRVATEIAERKGIDPINLSPPLNTVIDPDALEALFCGENDGGVRVEFTYAGHQITITGDQDIQIDVA